MTEAEPLNVAHDRMADKMRMPGPMEIASPILTFDDDGAWREHVRTVFDLLNHSCRIETDFSCGFHVHVSPGNREWHLDELKSICIAILYFEQAMFDILPVDRRSSGYLYKNSLAADLRSIGPEER